MKDLIVAHDITSNECQADHLMRPVAFMHACQEVAELHASENGLGYEWSVANHTIWVEVQGDFRFIRRPEWKETITLRTNTGKASALQAHRFVEMSDKAGKVICQADLHWVLIDVESRRPVPLKRVNLNLEDASPCIIGEPMPAMPECPLSATAEFTAPRRDVDFNGHINNGAYLIWVLDTLPEELCPAAAPARVLVRFKHETYAGEPVKVEHFVSGKMSKHVVSSNGTVRAELTMLWD